MIIPIRCFTCGKPIAAQYEAYKERVEKGEEPKTIMDDLGLKRYCCRRMIISQADLVDEIGQFKV